MCTQHHLPGTEGSCFYSPAGQVVGRSCTAAEQRGLGEEATLQGRYINCYTCPFLDVRCFPNNIWLARHPQFLVLRVVTGQLWHPTKWKTCHYRLHPHEKLMTGDTHIYHTQAHTHTVPGSIWAFSCLLLTTASPFISQLWDLFQNRGNIYPAYIFPSGLQYRVCYNIRLSKKKRKNEVFLKFIWFSIYLFHFRNLVTSVSLPCCQMSPTFSTNKQAFEFASVHKTHSFCLPQSSPPKPEDPNP